VAYSADLRRVSQQQAFGSWTAPLEAWKIGFDRLEAGIPEPVDPGRFYLDFLPANGGKSGVTESNCSGFTIGTMP
jgi:hypothetical protein